MRGFLQKVGRPASEQETVLARLIPIVPFACIEAWTLQNLLVARAKCPAHPACQAKFDEWERDRGHLDEEMDPKPKTIPCFEDRENLALATESFPAREAMAVTKSFFATALELAGNEELNARLQATWTMT